MTEELTANFNQQVAIPKVLTVQLHEVRYLGDHEVYAVKNKQFKSYIKAEFNLDTIPGSAVIALTHLQSPHENNVHAPVNISVNSFVINVDFQPTGNEVYSTDAIPLIPSEHLHLGSNYVTISSGKDMQTEYWIKSLQISLTSDKYIEGQADFSRQFIEYTGDVNSVTANSHCHYQSSDKVRAMDNGGQINVSFNVASLTNLVPPSVQVTLEWRSSCNSAEPGYSPVDLIINGTPFQSKISSPTDGFSTDTFDVPTMNMNVGNNVLQISTRYQDMRSPLLLKNVYVNGNRQGYLHHQFQIAVEKATPSLLEFDGVLDVVPSVMIGNDSSVINVVLIYTAKHLDNLPLRVANAPVRQIVSNVPANAPVRHRASDVGMIPPGTPPDIPLLQGGLAIGPTEWERGTLGAVMFTNNIYRTSNLVTAAHVALTTADVAKVNDPNGEPIYAEFFYAPTTRLTERNKAGKNPVFTNRNLDGAAYFLNQDRDFTEGIESICNFISGVLEPKVDMIVMKNGAATGITFGRVAHIVREVVIIMPLPGEEGDYINQNGDSGAVWLTEANDKYYAVALLLSGRSAGPTKEENYSVGTKMSTVINALSRNGRPLTFTNQRIPDAP